MSTWARISDAIPDAFTGILKRHMEAAYDHIASSSVGRKFAQALKRSGSAGRAVSEFFLNLVGAIAADAIPHDSELGKMANEMAKDAPPELLSRFLNHLSELGDKANTPVERTFARMVLSLHQANPAAAQELLTWIESVRGNRKRQIIAAISHLSDDELGKLMEFSRPERQSLLELEEFEEELGKHHTLCDSVASMWEAAQTSLTNLGGNVMAGIAWYFRYLMRFLVATAAAGILWGIIVNLLPNPNLAGASTIILGFIALPTIFLASPLIAVGKTLYQRWSFFRTVIRINVEAVCYFVLLYFIMWRGLAVSPRLTMWLIVWGTIAAFTFWANGDTLVSKIGHGARWVFLALFVLVSIGLVGMSVAHAFPASRRATEQMTVNINSGIARLFGLNEGLTETQILEPSRMKFDDSGTLYRCITLEDVAELDDHYRCYQRRTPGHDPIYNRADIPLTGEMVSQMEKRQQLRRARDEALRENESRRQQAEQERIRAVEEERKAKEYAYNLALAQKEVAARQTEAEREARERAEAEVTALREHTAAQQVPQTVLPAPPTTVARSLWKEEHPQPEAPLYEPPLPRIRIEHAYLAQSGTIVPVTLLEPLSSKTTKRGTTFTAHVAESDEKWSRYVPPGTLVTGVVIDINKGRVQLQLTGVDVDGQHVPITTNIAQWPPAALPEPTQRRRYNDDERYVRDQREEDCRFEAANRRTREKVGENPGSVSEECRGILTDSRNGRGRRDVAGEIVGLGIGIAVNKLFGKHLEVPAQTMFLFTLANTVEIPLN